MYICVCKAITEDDLEKAVRECHSTKEVLSKLGVGSECGVCVLNGIAKLGTLPAEKQDSSSPKKKVSQA